MSTIVSTHKTKHTLSIFTLLIGFVFILSACGQALDEDDNINPDTTLRAQTMTTSDGPLPDPFDAPTSMTHTKTPKTMPVVKTVKLKRVYLPKVESTIPKHPIHQ